MIHIDIDGHVHGRYSVTIKCKQCNLAVFSGQSTERDNVERVIRNKFAEAHIGCDAEWENAIDNEEAVTV
jgi:hypothetical protein